MLEKKTRAMPIHSIGMTVKDWSKTNGFSASSVYKVLSGQRKSKYGIGFEIKKKLEEAAQKSQ